MLLTEIITSEVTFNSDDNRFKRPTIGSGAFSTVHKDQDPHMVHKRAKGSKETSIDGFWIYVNYIIEYKLWDNPYFPRVYNKNIDSSSTASTTLEKLEPISKLRPEEVGSISQKIFGTDEITNVGRLAEIIEKSIEQKKVEGALDDEYIKAVYILHRIAKKENLIVDVSDENIMIRRTPIGVQLVITDPFSHKI